MREFAQWPKALRQIGAVYSCLGSDMEVRKSIRESEAPNSENGIAVAGIAMGCRRQNFAP